MQDRRHVLKGALAGAAAVAAGRIGVSRVHAADPIRIGFATELTGSLALNGKQVLLTGQIWQDDVNKKGGLLGRPVELVYYDDQSNPSLVPAIYTKLLDVDRVDLVMGYGTNVSSAAMPTVIQHNKLFIDTLALAVNEQFHYPRFFQTMQYGPDGKDAISRGYFEAAMTMDPKPKTVALAGADAEFSKSTLEGARKHIQRLGLKTVYDRPYPPNTVDYGPIVRAIKATNPDLVFIGSYPQDTAGILRAVIEQGVNVKMFGGAMVGLQYGAMKAQLGPKLNGVVCYELFVHEPTMNFPGTDDFIKKYQQRAKEAGTDALGYYVPPLVYATWQVLEQAIEGTGSIDDGKLADYIHKTTFKTVIGDITFGPDGEWAKPRILTIQYQNIKDNELEQFTRPGTQVILDPPEFRTGKLQYPFSEVSR
jgi:branched-chain amino acid transport system substrate-binding protein